MLKLANSGKWPSCATSSSRGAAGTARAGELVLQKERAAQRFMSRVFHKWIRWLRYRAQLHDFEALEEARAAQAELILEQRAQLEECYKLLEKQAKKGTPGPREADECASS